MTISIPIAPKHWVDAKFMHLVDKNDKVNVACNRQSQIALFFHVRVGILTLNARRHM